MQYSVNEILETIQMVKLDKLDIRTVTLGINLLKASDKKPENLVKNIQKTVYQNAKNLVKQAHEIEEQYGIPIINKRVTITPIAAVISPALSGNKERDYRLCLKIAKTLDQTAQKLNIDFIGGFGCLTENGLSYADQIVIESLPQILNQTQRVCSFVNVGTSRSGINMRSVVKMGNIIHKISLGKNRAIAAAKLVVFCNAVTDNPFMAGGFHGLDQPDSVINIGISGPGVVRRAIEKLPQDAGLDEIAAQIKKTAFKITRAGETIGRELAKSIGVQFGIIDLSLAPTTQKGDSVGEILEKLGLETVGTHGTTAALALLTDSVKKGGLMASSNIGGLSGAFIPVAEDKVLSDAVKKNVLSLDKLEAMTSICSVGLDMVAVPGNTKTTTLAAIIADEAAIGMINHKTTAVRIIPVKNKKAGDYVNFGGLLGGSYLLKTHSAKSDQFIWRKGTLPAPITGFKN
ncbi:MAG: DUF711 family protein [Candidatus Moranbacteria bacterium]|nr:DUF711 family protein [Candidatus Moranbacteria bacterium]